MRIRRRDKAPTPDLAPVDRLWQEIGHLFKDQTGYYPGPDVGFDGLSSSDVQRLWAHLEANCRSLPDEPVSWAPHDTEHQPLKVPEDVGLVLDGSIENVALRLRDLQSHGESLPDVFVELWADGFNLYWWTGHPDDDWTPAKAAALVTMIGQLWALVPDARLDYEDGDDTVWFWDIVRDYSAALG